MSLRLAFLGTPQFSATVLEALVNAGHEIIAVYTQPPRKAGRRGLTLTPSPVARYATDHTLSVFTPASLKTAEEQQRFQALEVDAAVVVAYGLILPKAILESPRLGCYNVHASLLPRWRGAAPIQRAIMAGDDETGITIMKMDEGLDTGPIVLTERVAINAATTSGELFDQLSGIGARLMVETLFKLQNDTLRICPQPATGVTYANKITKEETRIDWCQPAKIVQKRICGLAPFPGAWCEMIIGDKKERVKLLGAELATSSQRQPGTIDPETLTVVCGDRAIKITSAQRAGGKILTAEQFRRGAKVSTLC